MEDPIMNAIHAHREKMVKLAGGDINKLTEIIRRRIRRYKIRNNLLMLKNIDKPKNCR